MRKYIWLGTLIIGLGLGQVATAQEPLLEGLVLSSTTVNQAAGQMPLVIQVIPAPVPRWVKVVRWVALGGIVLNDVTVLHPIKADVRAAAAASAEWGIIWGAFEQKHPRPAGLLYAIIGGANTGAGLWKIHARWGVERQF